MPLYEFRCPNGHDFERFFRSINAAPTEVECPECKALAQRRISAAGFQFKGSGFYITDYGKDGKKAEREAAKAKSEKPAVDAKSSDATATTATKPAESAGSAKEAPAVKPATAKKEE